MTLAVKDIDAIDCHIHCGIQNVNQSYEMIVPYLDEAGISAACMFPPVEDIYDRNDPDFVDTSAWQMCREKANDYLYSLSRNHDVYPYFFVWNDFRKDDLSSGHKGIKWHRHSNEPIYEYNNPACEEFLQKVYEMHIPIVLEEEYNNTLYLIERVNGRTPIIIPHLGSLNGGYKSLKEVGIWKRENVYADTALAYSRDIVDFIGAYGAEKLFFGSDFPFGIPYEEKEKILQLGLREEDCENILHKNIKRLLRL